MIQRLTRHLNPVTRKRLRRFRGIRRAWWSLVVLVVLYILSLGSELICGNTPLYVRYEGRSYFPVLSFYSEETFTNSENMTRPDYKAIARSEAFRGNPANWMLFPPIPYGPEEKIDPERLEIDGRITVRVLPQPHVGSVNVRADGRVVRSRAAGWFFGIDDAEVEGRNLKDAIVMDTRLTKAIERRLANRADERLEMRVRDAGGRTVEVSMPAFRPRRRQPDSVRLRLTEATAQTDDERLVFDAQGRLDSDASSLWRAASGAERERVEKWVAERRKRPLEKQVATLGGARVTLVFEKRDVRFPFPPTWPRHPLGLDESGRDVLVRIVYGFRISMSFAVLLVVTSMALGTVVGALQGYFGGLVDIAGQRLIEIWSALPFLYVMILMGSIFGSSFVLLLVVYGIFNWIGISYYMRAEFLRLRRRQFVEAARAMGVGTSRILFAHILPNALVPLVTFFPFQLVGAIGALAALDYLGFGMPPPTPSWGQLLQQAGAYRWAWWLILFPSLALFFVILMGVFVGEGLRAAFDPRDYESD